VSRARKNEANALIGGGFGRTPERPEFDLTRLPQPDLLVGPTQIAAPRIDARITWQVAG
jgi:hypothetical protein